MYDQTVPTALQYRERCDEHFPTVTPWAFMLATACATPKLMIHVFIGERLARLAEADQKMDTKTKLLNYSSIIGGKCHP